MGKPTFDLYYSENLLQGAQPSGSSVLRRRLALANALRSDARSECRRASVRRPSLQTGYGRADARCAAKRLSENSMFSE